MTRNTLKIPGQHLCSTKHRRMHNLKYFQYQFILELNNAARINQQLFDFFTAPLVCSVWKSQAVLLDYLIRLSLLCVPVHA